MDIEVARNEGIGMAPTPSPSDVTKNAATMHPAADDSTPTIDGLASDVKERFLSRKWTRMGLGLLCLTPLVVTLYLKAVPVTLMRGEEGTWESTTWQHDIPLRFRTKLQGDSLLFFSLNASADACETLIGMAPRPTKAPLPEKRGWINDLGHPGVFDFKMTAWVSAGQLAISYDESDPWVFFTRGPAPKRTVTALYRQIDTQICTN